MTEDKTKNRSSSQNLRSLGAREEMIAACFLKKHGVVLTEKNFRNGRMGEIDLIGWDQDVLVFFEVKYRSSYQCGFPEEAITSKKKRKIRQAAKYYLSAHHFPLDQRMRFDVVALMPVKKDTVHVHWIKNAFMDSS